MATPTASAPFGARRRLSAFFYRHRWLKLLGLLIPPLGWLIVVYLAAAGLSTFERVRNGAEFLYGEAIVLDEVHRLGHAGQPLYPAPTALPLTITAYPPVVALAVNGGATATPCESVPT